MKYYEIFETKPALEKRIAELEQMGLTEKDYEVLSKARIEGTDVDFVEDEPTEPINEPVDNAGVVNTTDIYDDRVREDDRSFVEKVKDFFTGETPEATEKLRGFDVDKEVQDEALELVRKGSILLFIDEDKLNSRDRRDPVREEVRNDDTLIDATDDRRDETFIEREIIDPADRDRDRLDETFEREPVDPVDREPTLQDPVTPDPLLREPLAGEPHPGDGLDDRPILDDTLVDDQPFDDDVNNPDKL